MKIRVIVKKAIMKLILLESCLEKSRPVGVVINSTGSRRIVSRARLFMTSSGNRRAGHVRDRAIRLRPQLEQARDES